MSTIASTTSRPQVLTQSHLPPMPANAPAAAGYTRAPTAQAVAALFERGASEADAGGAAVTTVAGDQDARALSAAGAAGATVQANGARLQQAEQAVQGAQAEVHAQEQALAAAQSRVAQARLWVPAPQAQAVARDVEVARVQGERAAAQVPVAMAQREVDARQARVDAAQAQVQAAQAKVAQGEADMAASSGHKNGARRGVAQDAAKAKTELGRQMLAQAQQELARAQAQLDEVKAKQAPLAEAAAAAQARLEAAKQEAAQARAQLQAQTQKVEDAIAAEFSTHKQLRAAQAELVKALQTQAQALIEAGKSSGAAARGGIQSAWQATEQSLASAHASIEQQERALAAAQATAERERSQGQPLDAKAGQAEVQANRLKAAFDAAQLGATQAQQKVDAAQADYDGVAAEIARAQQRVDKAIDQQRDAHFHKKKGNRLRALQEADWEMKAAREELAAAQAKLEPLRQALVQAKAQAQPLIEQALQAQARWVSARTMAGALRGEATQQAQVAEQAVVLELGAQSGLQAAQALYLQIAQIEMLARQEVGEVVPPSHQELAEQVQSKERALAAASAAVARQEQSLAQRRAGERREREAATPLQAQLLGHGLIAQNLAADAQSSSQLSAAAQEEVKQARAELQAAKENLRHWEAEFARGEVLQFRSDYVKKPKKKAAASQQAQEVVDAARQALPEARARLQQAEDDLARALRRAQRLRGDAQHEQLAAQGAAQDAQTVGGMLAAQEGWVTQATARHQAADAALASAQAVLVQAQLAHAQALQALSGASGGTQATALAEQASQAKAAAERYAQLAESAREAAASTRQQQLQSDEMAVRAAAPQMLGEFLQAKSAAAAQAYDQSKAQVGQLQTDFEQATQKAGEAAPLADEARRATTEQELEASLEFARSRGANIPRTVSADSMMARARQMLLEQAAEQAPMAPSGGAAVMAGVPGMTTTRVSVDEQQVRTLAEQLAQQENERLQQMDSADKAAQLEAWQSSEMSRRKTLGKQLHLLDDLAQHKEGNAAVKAARQHSVDTAQALKAASREAIDAGERVQDAVARSELLGRKALAAQTQLSQVSSIAAQAAADAGAQAGHLVKAHEVEQQALQSLLAELSDSGTSADAARVDNAKAAAEQATQAIAQAKASAAEWERAATALVSWGQQQGLVREEMQAAVEQASRMLGDLARQSGATLAAVRDLNGWAQAVLQEHIDRSHDVQKLHERRIRQDAIDRNARKKALLKMFVMAAVALAAIATAQFYAVPALIGAGMGTLTASMVGFGAMAALGSAAGQGLSMGLGLQPEGFDIKSVALTGLSAAATAGAFNFLQGTELGATLLSTNATQPLTVAQIGLRGLTASGINTGVQGAMVASGLQDKFDWAQVAVAGLAAGVGVKVTETLGLAAQDAGSFVAKVKDWSEWAYKGLQAASESAVNTASALLVGTVIPNRNPVLTGSLATIAAAAADGIDLGAFGPGQAHPNANIAAADVPPMRLSSFDDVLPRPYLDAAQLDDDAFKAAGGAHFVPADAPTRASAFAAPAPDTPLGPAIEVMEFLHGKSLSAPARTAPAMGSNRVASVGSLRDLGTDPFGYTYSVDRAWEAVNELRPRNDYSDLSGGIRLDARNEQFLDGLVHRVIAEPRPVPSDPIEHLKLEIDRGSAYEHPIAPMWDTKFHVLDATPLAVDKFLRAGNAEPLGAAVILRNDVEHWSDAPSSGGALPEYREDSRFPGMPPPAHDLEGAAQPSEAYWRSVALGPADGGISFSLWTRPVSADTETGAGHTPAVGPRAGGSPLPDDLPKKGNWGPFRWEPHGEHFEAEHPLAAASNNSLVTESRPTGGDKQYLVPESFLRRFLENPQELLSQSKVLKDAIDIVIPQVEAVKKPGPLHARLGDLGFIPSDRFGEEWALLKELDTRMKEEGLPPDQVQRHLNRAVDLLRWAYQPGGPLSPLPHFGPDANVFEKIRPLIRKVSSEAVEAPASSRPGRMVTIDTLVNRVAPGGINAAFLRLAPGGMLLDQSRELARSHARANVDDSKDTLSPLQTDHGGQGRDLSLPFGPGVKLAPSIPTPESEAIKPVTVLEELFAATKAISLATGLASVGSAAWAAYVTGMSSFSRNHIETPQVTNTPSEQQQMKSLLLELAKNPEGLKTLQRLGQSGQATTFALGETLGPEHAYGITRSTSPLAAAFGVPTDAQVVLDRRIMPYPGEEPARGTLTSVQHEALHAVHAAEGEASFIPYFEESRTWKETDPIYVSLGGRSGEANALNGKLDLEQLVLRKGLPRDFESWSKYVTENSWWLWPTPDGEEKEAGSR